LELSGKLSFEAAQERLDEHGLFVDCSPSPASLVGNAIANPFRARRHVFAMTFAKTPDLEVVAAKLDSGALRAAPTQVFPFERFGDAFALSEGGGVIGKVVVRVASEA
jgi:NADPH:quinone reductase-like Zn-dependent oxidoreductase